MTSRTARYIYRALRRNSRRPASWFSTPRNQRYDRKIQTRWFKLVSNR